MCGPWYEYWIIFLMFVGAAEQAQQARKVESSQQLRVGMTQAEVLDIMGPPDIDYCPRWNHWCYGISFDLDLIISADGRPSPFPIHLRLFTYEDEDVVIRWGIRDKALKIDRPKKLEVPDEFHEILDTCIFIHTVFELLAAKAN